MLGHVLRGEQRRGLVLERAHLREQAPPVAPRAQAGGGQREQPDEIGMEDAAARPARCPSLEA